MTVPNISAPIIPTAVKQTEKNNISTTTDIPVKTDTTSQTKKPDVGIQASSVATTVSVATLVNEAKQKVIPQVGIQNADKVVNKDGSINLKKLAEIIAKQKSKSQETNTQDAAAVPDTSGKPIVNLVA